MNVTFQLEENRRGAVTDSDRALMAEWTRGSYTDAELRFYGEFGFVDGDWILCVRVDARLIGALKIVQRQVLFDRRPTRIGGIGGVITAPEWRGRGFSTCALTIAKDFLFHGARVEYGLLVCPPALAPYYARLGWRELRGETLVPKGDRTVRWPLPCMVLTRGKDERLPQQVDLCGPPF